MIEGLILSVALTSHIGWTGNFNDIHPTIAYEYNSYVVGAFRNSLYRTSLFASKIDRFDSFSVQYGIANNYENKVTPMLILRKPVIDHVNFMLVPSYDKTTKTAAMVLGLEFNY